MGMVVLVASKFAYPLHVKNKTSVNVSRVLQEGLLPVCVKRARQKFSDNGPGFVRSPFQEILCEWSIEHAKMILYIPNSNGLAERTVCTLIQILHVMGEK